MPPFLPTNLSYEDYWQAIYPQPLAYWQPALEHIRACHALPNSTWQRSPLGRNIVFICGTVVVKLSPPFWRHEVPREAAALQWVQNQLPIRTPELLSVGELDSWGYLVQTKLPGELLKAIWPTLRLHEKHASARQHGRLMAALHALPIQQVPAQLAFDWPIMLTEQAAECIVAMQRAGVQETLVADIASYLEQLHPVLAADTDLRLLHGDFDAINLLVERPDRHWRITGLVDWGDVKLGPSAHEFISPRVHMYREELNLLHSWYEGYELTAEQRTPNREHNLMVRAMLYYADEFASILGSAPEASQCQSWSEVAPYFWRMTAFSDDVHERRH
jgi:hygromycin-B 7''-O-kinase